MLILSSSKLDAAEAWWEYGAFCMRTDQRGRGEQCFREGLLAPTAHREEAEKLVANNTDGESAADIIPSGVGTGGANKVWTRRCGFALAASLLHQARVTDPLFLAEAERQAGGILVASEAIGDTGVVRVLLALIQEASGQLSLLMPVVEGTECASYMTLS